MRHLYAKVREAFAKLGAELPAAALLPTASW